MPYDVTIRADTAILDAAAEQVKVPTSLPEILWRIELQETNELTQGCNREKRRPRLFTVGIAPPGLEPKATFWRSTRTLLIQRGQ